MITLSTYPTTPERPVTRAEIDRLTAIIWWIKGYIAGAGDNPEPCPFGDNHIEALRRARVDLRKLLNSQGG